jgi:hypothetical protein
MNWAEVVARGTLLPDVEVGTSYGRLALKVRAKAIAVEGKEPDQWTPSSFGWERSLTREG